MNDVNQLRDEAIALLRKYESELKDIIYDINSNQYDRCEATNELMLVSWKRGFLEGIDVSHGLTENTINSCMQWIYNNRKEEAE
jgi:hypothetical protein